MDSISNFFPLATSAVSPPLRALTIEPTAAARVLGESSPPLEGAKPFATEPLVEMTHLQMVQILSGLMVAQAPAAPKAAVPAADTRDLRQIKQFIGKAAQAYGTNPKVLDEIARRESTYQSQVVNNWDSNARRGTPSGGMFQFIRPTFNSMAPRARASNPQAWEGLGPLNWMDWRQQALTTSWAIKNGMGSHWSTYGAARRAAH